MCRVLHPESNPVLHGSHPAGVEWGYVSLAPSVDALVVGCDHGLVCGGVRVGSGEAVRWLTAGRARWYRVRCGWRCAGSGVGGKHA